MSEALQKILTDLGYTYINNTFGIDIFSPRIDRCNKYEFHGKEEEIIAWLKDKGEW